MNRVRQPFNVNSIALAAAAAALDDMEFVAQQLRGEPATACAQLEDGFARARASTTFPRTATSLVRIRVGKARPRVYQAAAAQGVIVRPVGAATACPSTCA